MSDQQITCAECGNIFVFSAAEQLFYSERGLASPPKRCKACRQARRASQEGGGGRGPSRDRGGRPTGNPNEYRAPMSNGYGHAGQPGRGGYGGQGQAAGGGWGNANARGPRPAWAGARPGRPNGAGPGGGGAGGAGADRGPSRPARFDGGNAHGNGAPPRFARPAAGSGESSWGSRPNEGGERPPRGPQGRGPKNRAPAAPRETKPNERPPGTKPERPRYDITCAECGTQSQVPFKPLEGRQVFCQPCYRARKGPAEAAPGQEGAASEDTDAGIVE